MFFMARTADFYSAIDNLTSGICCVPVLGPSGADDVDGICNWIIGPARPPRVVAVVATTAMSIGSLGALIVDDICGALVGRKIKIIICVVDEQSRYFSG